MKAISLIEKMKNYINNMTNYLFSIKIFTNLMAALKHSGTNCLKKYKNIYDFFIRQHFLMDFISEVVSSRILAILLCLMRL